MMARFAVSFAEDIPVAILGFLTEGESPTLPSGASWKSPGVWYRAPSKENVAAELKKAFPPGQPQPVSFYEIRESDIPEDASFRDSWKYDGRSIVCDMEKVRRIHLERLRAKRSRELENLDGLWMRAVGQKKEKEAKEVEARRQRLRDMPELVREALEAASSVDEVKAISLPE